jgi:membrane-associated protease RseP (regulator of RpoE activity)
MTSPSILSQPVPKTARRPQTNFQRYGIPALFFAVTMFSTTAVGMRYMHNFRLGAAPLGSDADILPYAWMMHHLGELRSGLPFSLTLIAILLAHEFGHFFACRSYQVRSTLPYLLPAPSLSGTFGAVIRLRSAIRSRAALMVIGASGPIAGFIVALAATALGLAWSTYAGEPLVKNVQPPLAIAFIHLLMPGRQPLALIVPHPVLIASWIGLLITALNLIPAGQLDGGHILYAISPEFHRWSSRFVIAALILMGIFDWAGWVLWGVILTIPALRHPSVPDAGDIARWHYALIPICLILLLLCGTARPFEGYSLMNLFTELRGHSR